MKIEPELENVRAVGRRSLVPSVLCTVVILGISLWPKPPEPPDLIDIPDMDKLIHVVMYAGYVAVIAWSWRAERRSWRTGAALVTYGAVFGVLMELLQAAVPVLERSLSVWDMIANVAGSVTGITFYRWARGKGGAVRGKR
jgi:VanZ family protein